MKAFDDAIADADAEGFRKICKSVFLDENNVDLLLAKYFGD